MRHFKVVLLTAPCALLMFLGCNQQHDRKIKLLGDIAGGNRGVQTGSTVLQVGAEERHTIAILPFENRTKDASLNWLSRGLADMLSAELSQSVYLSVVPLNRLSQILEELDQAPAALDDPAVGLRAAKRAQAETVITGQFHYDTNNIQIFAILKDVESGQSLRKEVVKGPSLERIFAMVADLSERLRSNLRSDLESPVDQNRRRTALTQSLEAFRCYSKAMENWDSMLLAEADTCLSDAIGFDSTFASAYVLQAKVRFRLNDIKGGIDAARRAGRFPDRLSEPDRIWLRFFDAQMQGDLAELMSAMQDLLRFEPSDVATRMQLANLHFTMCDYNRALAEYELILEMDPDRKIAYNQLAYIHGLRGDFTTAHAYLDKYATLAPDEPNPFDSRGEVFMMAGRFDEARRQFETALATRPDFRSSIEHLTEVHGEMNEFEQAAYYSDQWIAASANPIMRSKAYLKRALLLWRFGRLTEAREAISLAMKNGPESVQPIFIGAEMNRSAGDTERARQLSRVFLKRLKRASNAGPLGMDRIFQAMLFFRDIDLPPMELIPVLDRLTESESRPMLRQMYDLQLGLLYYRAGQPDIAKKYCENQGEEYLDLLVQFPNEGRGQSWKYPIEAVRWEAREASPDYSYFDKMQQVAKKAGRKDVEVMANFLMAQYQAKYDLREATSATYAKVGSPLEEDWRIIGPFPNRSGFRTAFPPEDTVDLAMKYEAGGRSLAWQSATDGVYDGFVDLRATIPASSWAVGYGLVYINSPDKRKVQLRVASDEACKLWLNDRLVWQIYRTGEVALDQDIISVVLHPGDNKLLIKVTNQIGDWGYYLRVTNESGDGFSDIQFHAPGEKSDRFASRAAAAKSE